VTPEQIRKWGGGTGPERQWGGTEKKFLVVPLHLFGSKITISRFGERFCDGQYSLVSFLFAVRLLTVPPPCPAQPFVKVGARAPVPHGVGATAVNRSRHFSNGCESCIECKCTILL